MRRAEPAGSWRPVSGPLLVSALVLVFLGVQGVAQRLPPRRRSVPFLILGTLLGAACFEASRFDHGRGDLLFAVAYVAAPVVAIFAGSLWGAKRFYGWPDLGPTPGRAAAVAALVLLGVLGGTLARERDVRETERRAEVLRARVVAWRDQHGGTWPSTLEVAVSDVPRTALGWVAPPPFSYEAKDARAVLGFPLSTERRRLLDLGAGTWTTERAP
jgi:hypothetical protein